MKGFTSGALPQQIVEKMRPEDRKGIGLHTNDEKFERNSEKLERKIQAEVESYLTLLGYERRTPDAIARGMPNSGWFIHLHETKRNPILLDLLILSNSGEYMELELKSLSGRVRPEQMALVAQGGGLVRSTEEAMKLIKGWHDDILSRRT